MTPPAVPASEGHPAGKDRTGKRATGMRWWGRLLLVLAFEAVLIGAYALEARPATFRSIYPPWPTYVAAVFLLVVVIQGDARWGPRTWGIVWLLGGLAAFSGVAGAAPAYVAHVSTAETVTVVQADREVVRGSSNRRVSSHFRSYSVAQVRTADGSTETAYLRGDWDGLEGRTTTVQRDPLGVAGLQSATKVRGLTLFWFVVWVPSFTGLQLGLLAVVFRRGPSMASTGGT